MSNCLITTAPDCYHRWCHGDNDPNLGLDEAAYRGDRFKGWHQDVKGNNDLLNLTQPSIIQAIHRQYLESGADLIETNTLNSTSISMADYRMEGLAWELNIAGAQNA